MGPMIIKNLRIRVGSDSIVSDQNWTRTEKFYSPLISGSTPSVNVVVSNSCLAATQIAAQFSSRDTTAANDWNVIHGNMAVYSRLQ